MIHIYCIVYLIIFSSIICAADIQNIDEETRRILLEKILGSRIKNTSPNPKVDIPKSVLRRYYNEREKYRSIVPNDTIYFGKLNNHIDFDRIDFWNAIDENYKIELGTPSNLEESPSYYFGGQYDEVGSFPAEIEPVPERIDLHLPPNYYGEDKQFQSVHLKFDLSSITTESDSPWQDEELIGAELGLYREGVPGLSKNQTYQKIYILVITGLQDNSHVPITHIIDAKKVDISRSNQINFDLKEQVKTWLRDGSKNHGIYVRVTNTKGKGEVLEHVRLHRQYRNTSDSEQRWSDIRPKLDLFRKSNLNGTEYSMSGRRDRRQVSHSRTGPRTTMKASKCSLKSYTIRFDDIGWSNWIIAPSELNINLCSGDCSYPIADAQRPVNHAIVQALFAHTFRSVPRPPCVPIEFSPVSLLYQIDSSVRIRTYNDIIAEACGCV